MAHGDEKSEEERPPAYLSEKFDDLLEPRFAAVASRRWMEAYHSLEVGEEGARGLTRIAHTPAIQLWLQCLTLFRAAFSATYEWNDATPPEERDAEQLRLELLGLAATSSKPTLDALMGGYYTVAFGLIRNLLETGRRVIYVRLRPAEALPYFEPPTQSPIGPDGMPRDDRNRGVPFANIRRAIEEGGTKDDSEAFKMMNAGITHMHAGAHPTAEGLAQLRIDRSGRRIFGPNYNRLLSGWAFKWALYAHLILLAELRTLANFGEEWDRAAMDVSAASTGWLQVHQAEFDELMKAAEASETAEPDDPDDADDGSPRSF